MGNTGVIAWEVRSGGAAYPSGSLVLAASGGTELGRNLGHAGALYVVHLERARSRFEAGV